MNIGIPTIEITWIIFWFFLIRWLFRFGVIALIGSNIQKSIERMVDKWKQK